MFKNSAFRKRLARKIIYILLRIIQLIRIIIFQWVSTKNYEGSPAIHQPIQFAGDGKIIFGSNVNIGVFPSPYYLSGYAYIEARGKSAVVEIGDNTWINNNFVAIAEHSIICIGKDVLMGTNVEIYDSDFHGLQRDLRKVSLSDWAKPVVIGDEVFIGSNVKILKGVTIGTGAVVANGSIVSKDIPENVVAAGNPARVIRHLIN